MDSVKLQEVNISLWNKYQVIFRPNPDVNIIVGINGSGKTTLLSEIEIELLKRNGKDTSSYIYVPSIDNLPPMDGRKKKENILTQTLNSYIYYNKEGQSLMYYRMSMIDANSAQEANIRHRTNEFCEVINELFEETGKNIEIKGNKFIINSHGRKLTIAELSSGEKQILLLLLRIFLLNQEEAVVLIDEPENSLDISWQYKLVDLFVRLNPKAQFFITTHSPSIFGDGWGEKVIYMEEVTKEINTVV